MSKPNATKRKQKRRFLLALPNYTVWNILVSVLVAVDFYLSTLCFTLLDSYATHFVPFFIIFDIIYIFNLALLLLHRFWKKLSTKLSETVKTSSPVLVMDLASILPQVTLLLIYFRPDYKNFVLYCRLAVCLRLHRTLFFRKVQQKLLQNRWIWYLTQSILYLSIILHTMNAVWFLISRDNYFCTELASWDKANTSRIESDSLGKQYFLTMYLSLRVFFNVGFGDTNASNYCRMLWFIFTMIIGQFLSITFIAVVCWLVINSKFHELVYQQMVSYVGKYVEKHTNPTKNHIEMYYKYLWKHYGGIHDAQLLTSLPSTLQMDVAFDVNHGLLSRSLLLKDLPTCIQRKVALAMKTVLLGPGQSVYQKGITKRCMVCVKGGLLEVLYDHGGHSSTIFFKEGTILGEVSLFLNVSSNTTVRATKYSELRVLDKPSLLKILLYYPKELKNMRNMVAYRIDLIKDERRPEDIASRNLKTSKVKLSGIGDSNIEDSIEMSLYNLSKNPKLPGLPREIFRRVTENVVLMKIWLFLLAVIQTVYCLSYPYYAVFEKYVPYDVYVFGEIADAFYCVDVLLQCITAVKFKDRTVTKVIEIIDIRLEHWSFYCDVFSLFPIEVWTYFILNPSKRRRTYDLLKLNRLLRIWRFTHLLEFFDNGTSIFQMLKYTTYSIIFTYFTSCLLYLNTCPDLFCKEESWYHQKIIKDLQQSKEIEYNDSILPTSLYFTVMSVFHTGLGHVLPQCDSDIAIVTCIMLISVVLKAYCISKIVSFVFVKEFCTKTYETFFDFKASLNHFQLPKQLKEGMRRWLTSPKFFVQKYVLKFTKTSTSEVLKDEVTLSLVQNSLFKLPFLKMADPYFLAMLEKEAKVFVLPENETLYHRDDRTRIMYVLQQGYCNLYTTDYLLERTVGPGTQMGTIEMVTGTIKRHTVIAASDCVVVALDLHSFSKILKLFPKEYNALEDILKSTWFLRMMKRTECVRVKEETFGVLYRKLQIKALILTSWKKLWETNRLKLGMFWPLGFLLAPFTIHPQSLFIKIWCTIRCSLIVASGIALSLVTMLPPFADSLYLLVFVCDCSLYLDMYILLHTAYYDSTGQLETRPLYTAWHYVTHSFVMDLLAAIPLTQISYYIDPSSFDHGSTITHTLAPHYRHSRWKLLGLVQLHRVSSYLNFIKTNTWKLHLRTYVEVVKIFMMVAVLVNILASFMLSDTCGYEFEKPFDSTNETFHDFSTNSTYYRVVKCQNDFWSKDSTFGNVTEPSGLYVIAVYSIVNFLTNAGIENISGQSCLAMIGIVSTILIGYALFLFICSLTASNALQKAAMGMDFRKKVELLELFLKKNSVPTYLQEKVNGHLKFIWQRTKNIDYLNIIDNFEFTSTLTDDIFLRQYHSCLQHSTLFHSLDINSIRLIMNFIKIRHYKKGETITSYKEIINDVFIVVSGKVQLVSKNHYCFDTFGIGGTFGNIRKTISHSSGIIVKAGTNVELCLIPTKKLLYTIKNYPNVFRQIKEILIQELEYIKPHTLPVSDSHRDNMGSQYWDELESDVNLPLRKESSLDLINPLVVLKPHHFIFKVIDLLTLIASYLNVIFIPYVFVTQEQHYVCFVHLILEPIFYIRIYMKLRQAYYNFYGNFVKSNRDIIRRYFNAPSRVLWDAVSNFPLALVCFVREERFFLYSCLRMLHLLRFYYVLEYFKVHEEKFKLKLWLSLVKMVLLYIIFVHLFSCFWLMTACPFGNCYPGTWVVQNRSYIVDQPPAVQMLLSYYFIISTLTNTGIDDILPQNMYEVTATFVIMIVGKLMTIIFIGTMLRVMYISNFDLARFEYKAVVLTKHLQNQDLSSYQRKRIWSYTQNLWKYGNFPKLLHKLPYVLTCDIMMCLYGHHLRQNVLFKNTDEALLRQICSKFQRQLFFYHDCVIKSGDVNSCMYFIQNGSVAVLTEPGELSETEHIVLHRNDMFGISQGFGQGTPHHFTYRAASDLVEVLTLSFESWSYLLPHFPQDEAVIFARLQRECGKV